MNPNGTINDSAHGTVNTMRALDLVADVVGAKEQIERLRVAMREACNLLAERTYGNAARSPGHNARLCLESALKLGANS